MKQPPVAIVYYRPGEKEEIIVEPNPIPVQAGVKTLIWLQEPEPPTPWRFDEITFKSTVFRTVIVQDRVVTAVDVNQEKETIEYTICIVDETTKEPVCRDPEIENEFP